MDSSTPISQIYVAFIVIIGFVGNVYCVWQLRRTKLKKLAVGPYLLALAFSDTTFLVTLASLTFYNLGLDLINVPVLCQTTFFLSYTSSFLSNWYIAVLSFERFLAVYNPFRNYLTVASSRFKLQVSIITACSLVLNSWVLYCFETTTYGQYDDNETLNVTITLCQYRQSAEKYYQTLNLFDLVVSFALPLMIIMIFNCMVVRELCRSRKTFDKDRRTSTVVVEEAIYLNESSAQTAVQTSNSKTECWRRRRKNERKITIFLLTIAFTHLILNLPSYLHRVVISFMYPIENEETGEETDQRNRHSILDVIVNLIFYTQYSVNFILYSYNDNRWCRKFRSKCCKLQCLT